MFLLACGTLGTDDGGADNLPFRGTGPYTALLEPVTGGVESENTWFLEPPDPSTLYLEPSALVHEGVLELFVVQETPSGDTGARVLVRRSIDEELVPGTPVVVLSEASLPTWANNTWSAPSLTSARGRLCLAVEAGTHDGIVFFVEDEDGSFSPHDDVQELRPASVPEEAQGIGSPSVVWLKGELRVYYTGFDEAGNGHIREARWLEGRWKRMGTVLSPGTGCVDEEDVAAPCWDEATVFDSEVRVAQSKVDGVILRLLYAGHAGKKASLGFAAAYEGGGFNRTPLNPVMAPKSDLRQPSNVFAYGRYLLFYEERVTGGRRGVGLSESVGGLPSEIF
jgi:hypothetical protein